MVGKRNVLLKYLVWHLIAGYGPNLANKVIGVGKRTGLDIRLKTYCSRGPIS